MIKITNGKDILEVTEGAFKSIYKDSGFYPYEKSDTEPQEAIGTAGEIPQTPNNDNEIVIDGVEVEDMNLAQLLKYAEQEDIDLEGIDKGNEKELKEYIIEVEEDVDDEDEKFTKELLEKPIGNWKQDELKKFAKINDIDISETKSFNEAKEVVNGWIKEQAKK